MADDIAIKISAQIADLQSGLNDAVSAIKGAAEQISSGFKSAESAGQSFGGKLDTALNLGLFLEFKTVATETLGAVREAFESTIGKAEEFGLANAKFAAQMGISFGDAAALASALNDVGSSSEQFTGMVLRMEQRLKTSEKAFNDLGMATRDSSGNLLQGKALMDSAISTMEGFKQGTDQNSFALEVFGRSAAGVYDIMRVNNEIIDENKRLMSELGVVTGQEAAGAAAKLQLALSDTKDQFEFAAISIGQHLMPVVTSLIEQFNSFLTPALQYAIQLFEGLFIAVDLIVTGFQELGTVVGGALFEMGTALAGFGTLAYDVFTGQWSKVTTDFNEYVSRMKTGFNTTLDLMSQHAVDFVNRTKSVLQGLAAPEVAKEKSPYGEGGNKAFVDPKQTLALNQEKLASEQALALEEIKIEESKNANLYALGQKSLTDFVATEKELTDRKYAVEEDFYRKKMALDAGNVVEVQKDKDKILLLEEQHTAALLKIDEQAAVQRRQMHQADVQFEMQEADSKLQADIAHLQSRLKQSQITEEEEFALEKQLTTEVYSENLARLDAEIATMAQGTKEYQKAMQEREKLQQKFNTDIQKMDDKLAEYEKQKWDTLGSSIKSSFTGALNGMLLGTKTWQQGVGEIIDGIANAFLKMAEDMLTKWIATELEKMLFSKATSATSAVSQISAAAGVAGANTFASTAAIPIVGPELAPGAAAAAVASTMGFTSLAVAEKGMVLDRDRLVSAHKEEMILPADISRGLRGMISGKGGSAETHLHYAPQISGNDTTSLKDLLAKDSSAMRSWFNGAMRDGTIKPPKV